MLIENGANVNARNSVSISSTDAKSSKIDQSLSRLKVQWTPLLQAFLLNPAPLEVVRLLVDGGADVNTSDMVGHHFQEETPQY
jgi:hypothetical protein